MCSSSDSRMCTKISRDTKSAALSQCAIAYCEQVGDYVSRDLFAGILESEEEHIDWIETQLALMDRIGDQNYLAQKMES